MAEYVQIEKGGRSLRVARKAFDTIYRAKGFVVVGGKPDVPAEQTSSNPDSTKPTPSTAGKTSTKKKAAKKKAARKSPAKADDAAQLSGGNVDDETKLTDAD